MYKQYIHFAEEMVTSCGATEGRRGEDVFVNFRMCL
jgi:hypothetical protein